MEPKAQLKVPTVKQKKAIRLLAYKNDFRFFGKFFEARVRFIPPKSDLKSEDLFCKGCKISQASILATNYANIGFCLTVSRKNGNSVVRNFIKRRMREAIKAGAKASPEIVTSLTDQLTGQSSSLNKVYSKKSFFTMFITKPSIKDATFGDIVDEIVKFLNFTKNKSSPFGTTLPRSQAKNKQSSQLL